MEAVDITKYFLCEEIEAQRDAFKGSAVLTLSPAVSPLTGERWDGQLSLTETPWCCQPDYSFRLPEVLVAHLSMRIRQP